MSKPTTITVRLTPEASERLEALARATSRSKSHLASEAIESYAELQAWQISHIKAALAEDEEDSASVSHDEVARWIASWGTDHELPRPKPKKT
jgi:predicted transcriptional regulator